MEVGKIKQTDPDRRFRRVLSASTLEGDRVVNPAGEDLGKVRDLAIDLTSGRVAYLVLSYGGVLGIGDKLFAVPWRAVRIDEEEKAFVLDIDKRRLELAPGFDKDHWPDMADPAWSADIERFYTIPGSDVRSFGGGAD